MQELGYLCNEPLSSAFGFSEASLAPINNPSLAALQRPFRSSVRVSRRLGPTGTPRRAAAVVSLLPRWKQMLPKLEKWITESP